MATFVYYGRKRFLVAVEYCTQINYKKKLLIKLHLKCHINNLIADINDSVYRNVRRII